MRFFEEMGAMKGREDLPAGSIPKLAAFGSLVIDDAALMRAFCVSVHKLTFAVQANKIACGAAGIIETVLDGMEAHPSVVEVQSDAFLAINNMLASCAPNKTIFVNARGLEVLVSMAARHDANFVVSREICGVVKSLASAPDLHSVIVDGGAIERVCHAMGAQPQGAVVQERGCSAFQKLCASPRGKAAVLASTATACIRAAKRRHADVDSVVAAAESALRDLGVPG